MGKITPPTHFVDDLQRVEDPLPTLREIGASRAPAFNVDVTEITVLPDFNPRITGTPDYEEHVESLVASILENGFMLNKPLLVLPAEEDVDGTKTTVFYLIAGHTRFEAIQRINAKADVVEKITTVPVVTTNLSLAELTIMTVNDNNITKPLSPVELGIAVQRLVDYGTTKNDIARRLNITSRYVDSLLVLNDAPAKIKEAVRSGKMSATLAVETIRQHGASASNVVETATKEAAAAGKVKVTPKQMAGKAKPKKAAGKAKVAKAKETAKPAKKPDPIKASKAPAGSKTPVVAAALPATDNDFLRGAIEYALSLPKKGGAGLDWLAKMMAEDAVALGELESWLGQPKGAFFDTTLRVPVDKDGM